MEIKKDTLDIEATRAQRPLAPRKVLPIVRIPAQVKADGMTTRATHGVGHLFGAALAHEVQLSCAKTSL